MIPVTGGTRIFLYRPAADMRKGFDGLSGLVAERFTENLFSGALFVFVNQRLNRVKILYWDRGGLALWYKRLERGKFRLPQSAGQRAELTSTELAMLLEGITPLHVERRYEAGDGLGQTGA
jgi:transposase